MRLKILEISNPITYTKEIIEEGDYIDTPEFDVIYFIQIWVRNKPFILAESFQDDVYPVIFSERDSAKKYLNSRDIPKEYKCRLRDTSLLERNIYSKEISNSENVILIEVI